MVEGHPQPINITSGTDLALARNCLLWRHVTGQPEWMAGIARKTPGSNPGRPPRCSRCGEWVKNPNSSPGRAATGAPHIVAFQQLRDAAVSVVLENRFATVTGSS